MTFENKTQEKKLTRFIFRKKNLNLSFSIFASIIKAV